jgi:hypothetical protein
MKKLAFLLIIPVVSLYSCSKDPVGEPLGSVYVNLSHTIDMAQLFMDSLMYKNEANNKYSVSKLEYLISGVTLHGEKGEAKVNGVFYVNAFKQSTLKILLDSVAPGHYGAVSFFIGLNPEHNVTNKLPATTDFNGMYWPEQMGGGYHFLKMEGRFLDNNSLNGFAIHLGKNENLVKCKVESHVDVKKKGEEISLEMNINEWFRNPNKYDFNKDGNYTMGEPASLKKISQNGPSVFKSKPSGGH